VLLQRVSSARVSVKDREIGRIGKGLLIFVGVGREDGQADLDYMVGKVNSLRIFEDDSGKMNQSLREIGGELLLISQFTLYGDCSRGRRPSFDEAASLAKVRVVYDGLIAGFLASGVSVQTGEFQESMKVELVNNGPATFFIESPGIDRRDGV